MTEKTYFVGRKFSNGKIVVETFENPEIAALSFALAKTTGSNHRLVIGKAIPGLDKTAILARVSAILTDAA